MLGAKITLIIVNKCSVLGCGNIFVKGQASGFFRIPIIRENERVVKNRNRSGGLILFTFVQASFIFHDAKTTYCIALIL